MNNKFSTILAYKSVLQFVESCAILYVNLGYSVRKTVPVRRVCFHYRMWKQAFYPYDKTERS